MTFIKRCVQIGITLLALTSASGAYALDNDLVLSRFSEFDPQEFSVRDENGNITTPCVNACGTVATNRQNFENLVEDLGQVLGPKMGAPAETLGEAGFAFNFLTTFSFIDTDASHWEALEDKDPGTMFSGAFQVRKGLPFSFEVAGNFGYLFNSELFTLGADLKWALNEGFYYFPDLAIRGSANTLVGSPELNLVTAGGDMSASKSFGISGVMRLTPYVGYQMLFVIGSSRLVNAYPQDPRPPQFDSDTPTGPGSTTFNPEFVFSQYDTQVNRFFFGAVLNVWVMDLVLEGVIADVNQFTVAAGTDF